MDLRVGTYRPIGPGDTPIKVGEIPGGRCAIMRVVGYTRQFGAGRTLPYREWLSASGEEPRDFPIYCQRLSSFPEVPEHETVVELFLPLR